MLDAVNIANWVGSSQTDCGVVSQETAQQMQATVTIDAGPALRFRDVLPQLWHWTAFNETVATSGLGPDGHPKRGGFLPPVPLERRMWAGGSLQFLKPLHVGEPLTRKSTIRSVDEKQGANGPMVFVTVDHEISGRDGLAIRERQDIVYLPAPKTFAAPKPRPVPTNTTFRETFDISTPALFRYSAATFNSHRIHYDLPYAQEVEHYPGLVVHGPLQATLLMDRATAYRGAPPQDFSFRGVHPMFHFENLDLFAVGGEDGSMNLCTGSPRGHQGMTATARWVA